MRKLGWDGLLRRAMRFSGTADFSAFGDDMRFDEHGTLSFAGHRGEATQHYIFYPRGSAATIRFADGRLFHHVDLAAGMAVAFHDCAPDRYEGRYRVLGLDHWLLTWRVVGPRKRQVIASSFRRRATWDGHAAAGVAR